MSCGCKSEKKQEINGDNGDLKSFASSGIKQIYSSNIIARLLYFCIAAPLVILMLPIVYIILFNHLVLGNSTNIVNLFKKILLIDWYKNLKNKREEKRRLKEEMEESSNPENFEYKDFYVTNIDKIDSKETK